MCAFCLTTSAPHLPALAYAEAVQRKAASLGFEWPAVADALAKVAEEAAEVAQPRPLDEARLARCLEGLAERERSVVLLAFAGERHGFTAT